MAQSSLEFGLWWLLGFQLWSFGVYSQAWGSLLGPLDTPAPLQGGPLSSPAGPCYTIAALGWTRRLGQTSGFSGEGGGGALQ